MSDCRETTLTDLRGFRSTPWSSKAQRHLTPCLIACEVYSVMFEHVQTGKKRCGQPRLKTVSSSWHLPPGFLCVFGAGSFLLYDPSHFFCTHDPCSSSGGYLLRGNPGFLGFVSDLYLHLLESSACYARLKGTMLKLSRCLAAPMQPCFTLHLSLFGSCCSKSLGGAVATWRSGTRRSFASLVHLTSAF